MSRLLVTPAGIPSWGDFHACAHATLYPVLQLMQLKPYGYSAERCTASKGLARPVSDLRCCALAAPRRDCCGIACRPPQATIEVPTVMLPGLSHCQRHTWRSPNRVQFRHQPRHQHQCHPQMDAALSRPVRINLAKPSSYSRFFLCSFRLCPISQSRLHLQYTVHNSSTRVVKL